MEILRIKVKSIFTRTKIKGLDYVVNHYVGCQFGCKYCYANFVTKRFKENFDIKESWGAWIIIKENAPELVREYVPGRVLMSSVSDPYQPIERREKLTRKVLENMNKMIKLRILTKSDLVLRDVDLFKRFNDISIGITLNKFQGKVKDFLEPLTPNYKRRLKALEILKEEGIRTYAFISPIIPGIFDYREILEDVKDIVNEVYLEFLNLKKIPKFVRDWLLENFPDSIDALGKISEEKVMKEIGDLRLPTKIIIHR